MEAAVAGEVAGEVASLSAAEAGAKAAAANGGADERAKKGGGSGSKSRGPKTYVALADGTMLSLRIPVAHVTSAGELTTVLTANAQHLAKQQAQPVSLPTTVTEIGALVKRSLLAKAQMTSVLHHAPFRSRSSTQRATISSTSRVNSASIDYESRTTLS